MLVLQEVVARFENQGETQRHLEELKAENEREISRLTEERDRLQSDFTEKKYSGESKLSKFVFLVYCQDSWKCEIPLCICLYVTCSSTGNILTLYLNCVALQPHRKTSRLWRRGLSGLIHEKPTLVCLNLSNFPLKALMLGASAVCSSNTFHCHHPLCENKYFSVCLAHSIFSGCSECPLVPLDPFQITRLYPALQALCPSQLNQSVSIKSCLFLLSSDISVSHGNP